jgi:hypothetical protein
MKVTILQDCVFSINGENSLFKKGKIINNPVGLDSVYKAMELAGYAKIEGVVAPTKKTLVKENKAMKESDVETKVEKVKKAVKKAIKK